MIMGCVSRKQAVASILKEKMKERRVTQKQLAAKLRKSQAAVSRMLNGIDSIRTEEFMLVAAFLGFTPVEMMFYCESRWVNGW